MAKQITVVKQSKNGSKLLSDGTFVTPPVRLAFVHLDKARKQERDDGSESESFQVLALGKKGEDMSIVELAIRKAIKAKWGDKKPGRMSMPLRDQAEKADEYDGFRKGAIFFNASSKFKPTIVGRSPSEPMEASDIYSGCWARLNCNVYAWGGEKRHKGNNGVSIGLLKVQFLRDDEPFRAGSNPEEVFDDEDDSSDDDDDNDLL